MKRIIFMLAILLATLFLIVQADAVVFISGTSSGGAACTTPDNGDEIDEGFLGSGYENTWTETIGTNGSIDEDFTLTGSPPTDSCTEGVNIIADQYYTYTQWDNGSAIAGTVDIVLEIYIDSVAVAAWDAARLVEWDDDTGVYDTGYPGDIEIYNRGGTLYLRADGNSTSGEITFDVDTWYTLTLHLQPGADNSYFQCAECSDSTQQTFTKNTVDGRYLRVGYGATTESSANSYDIEVGYIYLNSP